MSEPDELEKIAQLAVQRGYWDTKAAREGVAMARNHTPSAGSTQPLPLAQRTFLRKLIERTCGLTYDELARLEKDALAAQPTNTPSKPLPRLGAAKPAQEVTEVTSEASAAPPQTGREEILTPQKKLPRLGAQGAQEVTEVTSEPAPPPPAPLGREEVITPTKKLPRLNAPKKKPEEPPPE
jgi:hypothetical protein